MQAFGRREGRPFLAKVTAVPCSVDTFGLVGGSFSLNPCVYSPLTWAHSNAQHILKLEPNMCINIRNTSKLSRFTFNEVLGHLGHVICATTYSQGEDVSVIQMQKWWP